MPREQERRQPTVCFGDDAKRLGEYAWYDENSDNTTHPVGQHKPNAWGLYDVHGNVWEWIQDWFAEACYRQRPNPDRDPKGPDAGDYRVLRGGSWFNGARDVRGQPSRARARRQGRQCWI